MPKPEYNPNHPSPVLDANAAAIRRAFAVAGGLRPLTLREIHAVTGIPIGSVRTAIKWSHAGEWVEAPPRPDSAVRGGRGRNAKHYLPAPRARRPAATGADDGALVAALTTAIHDAPDISGRAAAAAIGVRPGSRQFRNLAMKTAGLDARVRTWCIRRMPTLAAQRIT